VSVAYNNSLRISTTEIFFVEANRKAAWTAGTGAAGGWLPLPTPATDDAGGDAGTRLG